jgi:hypothetical protein
MRLLSKTGVDNKIRVENDELVDRNIRLRQFERTITERLNTIKESYEPDKLAKLTEFETFCKDIEAKKQKLLRELDGIGKLIESKKEIYYGLITKQDQLEERIYQATEQEAKLKLREAFVVDLEQKWRAKQLTN